MIKPNYMLKRVTGTFKKEKQLIFPKYISLLLQLKLHITKSFTKFFSNIQNIQPKKKLENCDMTTLIYYDQVLPEEISKLTPMIY